MQFRLPYPPGLRINALLISLTLLTLTGLLGMRAYTVAKSHLSETRDLFEREIPLQNLLFDLDANLTAAKQAGKKWEITRDPVYGKLVVKYRKAAGQTLKVIGELRPGFLPGFSVKAGFSQQQEQLRAAQERLTAERMGQVSRARDAAAGLLRMIAFAGILCMFITAWLMLLLYEGLIIPLRSLREATTRIREGELSCRMEARGVTELREMSQAFNSMAERLESLDKAKDEFLATISHEIRNPMAALKEGLNLLSSEDRKLSLESQRKCLSACSIASKRLEFMLNNLLNLSKSGSGIYARDFAPRNLCGAVQTAMDEVRPLAEKKQIQLRRSGPEAAQVLFHWDGLVQAFVNLLLNAIKYGAEGTTIEVAVLPLDGPAPRIQVEVVNSGADIAAEELPRIFDRFYRGMNSVKHQGMGVGLYVVKKVVEAHQGEVSASSSNGRTRFSIMLPRQAPPAGAGKPATPPPFLPGLASAPASVARQTVAFEGGLQR